uniref:Uncharacterized protein n=1 Tax=Meleagris gallopavo TaxID=9103 RepID=A0A803YMK3_MELGA
GHREKQEGFSSAFTSLERTHDGVEAEDCPESSELEDDTEGLSTRLSGTLSFSGHEENEEEEEEEDGGGEELQAGDAAQDGGRCWDGVQWGHTTHPRGKDAAQVVGAAQVLQEQLQGREEEHPQPLQLSPLLGAH